MTTAPEKSSVAGVCVLCRRRDDCSGAGATSAQTGVFFCVLTVANLGGETFEPRQFSQTPLLHHYMGLTRQLKKQLLPGYRVIGTKNGYFIVKMEIQRFLG